MKSKSLILILVIFVVAFYFYWKSKKKDNQEPEYYDGTLDVDVSKGLSSYTAVQGNQEDEDYQLEVIRYQGLTNYLPEKGMSYNTLKALNDSLEEKKIALDTFTSIKGQESVLKEDAKKLTTSDINRMIQDANEQAIAKWQSRKTEIENLVTQTRNWLLAKHKDGKKIAGKANNKSMFDKYVDEALSLNSDAEKIYFIDVFGRSDVKANVYKYGDLTKYKTYKNLYDACKELANNLAKKFTDEQSKAKSLMSLYTYVKNTGKTSKNINEDGTLIVI